MTFSSLAFLFVFFPIVFLLYYVCRKDQIRNILLIVASLFFYAFGEPLAVFVMLLSIGLNYLLGLCCAESFTGLVKDNPGISALLRKAGLIAAVVMNIGMLFVFKYLCFFMRSFGLADDSFNIALPIGISFFTFQGLSYVVDVYRDKENVQKNCLYLMLYISFFPQLIAGPIVKYHDISKQLAVREFSIERISAGIQRFAFGLGKKVLIAGPMGLMADSVFGLEVSSIGAASAWIAAISYLFQIYFDFSGYSDMAIGLGCIFGFDFKENFNKPYTAYSVQQFWRRWHISLSTWFKEYVYIPLGGNRKETARTYVNKFVVFLLTGLWHGANWTFICWGLLHGLALVIEDLVKKKWEKGKHELSDRAESLLHIAGRVYTLLFVMFAFVIFRADSLGYAVGMIGRCFTAGGSNAIAFSQLTPVYLIALVFAVIISSSVTDRIFIRIRPNAARIMSLVVYIASLIMLISGGYNPFIYFRF